MSELKSYKNKTTGVVIETLASISGGDWILVSEAPKDQVPKGKDKGKGKGKDKDKGKGKDKGTPVSDPTGHGSGAEDEAEDENETTDPDTVQENEGIE